MKIALFPGTFDPITLGHTDIIDRALPLFDKIVIGIGVNSQKKTMFSLVLRKEMLQACYGNNPKIEIIDFEGLTVKYAAENGIGFLLRGLRNGMDLEYEKSIDMVNRQISENIETVFLIADGNTAALSSTLVREVIKYKGKPEGLVPKAIIPLLC